MPLPPALKDKLARSPLAGVVENKTVEQPVVVVVTPAPPADPPDKPVAKKRGGVGPKCKICHHPHRKQIEAFYADDRSYRWIADYILKNGWEPAVREQSIERHLTDCLRSSISRTEGIDRSAKAFLEKIEAMADRIQRWLDEFESGGHVCARCREADEDDKPGKPESKDWRAGAAIVRELRGIVELQGKVLGHLRPDVEVTLINHPQFNAMVVPICEITAGCRVCGPKVAKVLDVDG